MSHGIGSMIIHAIIKGIIYDIIFKAMRHMTLPEAIAFGVVVIGGYFIFSRIFWQTRRRF